MRTTTLWVSVVVVALCLSVVLAADEGSDWDGERRKKHHRRPRGEGRHDDERPMRPNKWNTQPPKTDIFGDKFPKPKEPRIIDFATPVHDRKFDPSFKPVASIQPGIPVEKKHKHIPHHIRHPDPKWVFPTVGPKKVEPKKLRGEKDEALPANIWHRHEGAAVLPPRKRTFVSAHINDARSGAAEIPRSAPQVPVPVSAQDVTRYGYAAPPKRSRRERELVTANAHITPDNDHHRRHRRERRPKREVVSANAHITPDNDHHRRHVRARFMPRHLVSAVGHITPDNDGHRRHLREERRAERALRKLREPELVSARIFRPTAELYVAEALPEKHHHHRREPELVSAHVVRTPEEWSLPQTLPEPRVPDEKHHDHHPVTARLAFPR